MKSRSLFLAAGLACAMTGLVRPALAQEWSAEQREVWSFLLTCNEHYVARDLDKILDCFHDDFSGWRYGDRVPRNKESIAKFLPINLEGESLATDLRPISIRVFGNFAIAHYYLTEATRMPDGEVVRDKAIWTDIMLKEGNRWRWVADHGGPIE